MSKRLALILLTAVCAVCVIALAGGASGATATNCDLVASPSGSDSAAGTVAAPFRTAQKLVSALAAGETGCLEAGTYSENVTFRRAGTAGAPITLTSYPGETATIVGRMYVVAGADYVTVNALDLNGENPQRLESPMIDANYATFSYDDVTNDHTGICFGIGSATWGWATGTLITHDRIHDCGQLPATNYQHGLYIGGATDTTIESSLIYGNADRGIQLYPEADGTTIDHNIIDGNGEGIIISGTDGVALAIRSVRQHPQQRQRPPRRRVLLARRQPRRRRQHRPQQLRVGRARGHNRHLERRLHRVEQHHRRPPVRRRARRNYELSPTSPCLALVGDVQAAVDGTARAPAANASQPTPAAVSSTTASKTAIATPPGKAQPKRKKNEEEGDRAPQAARACGQASRS